MERLGAHLAGLLSLLLIASFHSSGQVTTSELIGTIRDPSGGFVKGAEVGVRSLDTGNTYNAATDVDGKFRIPQLPVGPYEVTVAKAGFVRYIRGPVVLRLNQDADLSIGLELAGVKSAVSVTSDAPLIDTTGSEIGANFDTRRIQELPLSPDRNVLKLALSAPGVSQLQSGQSTGFTLGGAVFSVNGMRLRSNNFMIDGQDVTEPGTRGAVQEINNPDIVAEFRLITNQFAPEYGRAAGAIVNFITKTGGNRFHGSLFAFHNDDHLNSRSNLDKSPVGNPPHPKFSSAPFRAENQIGGTLGGPIRKEKTFFFASLQRWTDRQLGSGVTISGVPTEEGRTLLDSIAGSRPAVRALLDNLPPAQAALPGFAVPVTEGGRTALIPLGSLSGSNRIRFDDWQWSARIDHNISAKQRLGGRYQFDDHFSTGDGQATPPGLDVVNAERRMVASAFLNSIFSPSIYNEVRLSYLRWASDTTAHDPASQRIPSIEVLQLGLVAPASSANRTAIGLPIDLPRVRFNNTYELQDTVGVWRGSHSMKAGIDFRRPDLTSDFLVFQRGSLRYVTLQDLADDVALAATINTALPGGGGSHLFFRYYDYFFFLQDEWRVGSRLTLTYGVRYETPGNSFDTLRTMNQSIVAAQSGDPRFALVPIPKRDTNNWAPRFGFNYRLGPSLVVRGGYARTYDQPYFFMATQVADSFPFTQFTSLASHSANAFQIIDGIRLGTRRPPITDPDRVPRTVTSPDFRSPLAEQFALRVERQLGQNWALSAGYIGTKGTALYQIIDQNPTVPGSQGTRRADTAHGLRIAYCNCTASIYHSLQMSVEKRLSGDFAMAAHYTWSSFIDGVSDILSPSAGDSAYAQDAYNRRADRARSSYDRPQRFTANAVYQVPFFRKQTAWSGKLLGGWQISPFVTRQSGAPFTALVSDDPGFRQGGVDGGVNGPIRANAASNLDLARMSIEQIVRAGGAKLFAGVTSAAPLGNLGRNILRANGIHNLDLGLIKNTYLREVWNVQFRAEFYNLTNTRNFGIPNAFITSTDFLNQWGTDGGNRRIVLALRLTF